MKRCTELKIVWISSCNRVLRKRQINYNKRSFHAAIKGENIKKEKVTKCLEQKKNKKDSVVLCDNKDVDSLPLEGADGRGPWLLGAQQRSRVSGAAEDLSAVDSVRRLRRARDSAAAREEYEALCGATVRTRVHGILSFPPRTELACIFNEVLHASRSSLIISPRENAHLLPRFLSLSLFLSTCYSFLSRILFVSIFFNQHFMQGPSSPLFQLYVSHFRQMFFI